jgi:hypothetical protein
LIISASGSGKAKLKTRTAIATTYISQWLSNVLLTAFGGGSARVMVARGTGAALPVALASTVLDRYLGFTTLDRCSSFFGVSLAAAGETRPLLPMAGALAVGLGALIVLVWGGSYVPLQRRWLRLGTGRFAPRATGLLRKLEATPGLSGQVLIASVAATVLGVAAYWGAIRCVSGGVGFSLAFAAAVLGTLASAIPISLSSWGLREGAVALVLSEAGALSTSDASLVALLNAAIIAFTSLIGLAVWLFVDWTWRMKADTVLSASRPTVVLDLQRRPTVCSNRQFGVFSH